MVSSCGAHSQIRFSTSSTFLSDPQQTCRSAKPFELRSCTCGNPHPDRDWEQTINASFLGSPRYEERQRYLTSLLTGGVEIFIGGGQREEGLSANQYAENIRKSKISLNFPAGPDGYDQCKGRVWEILATKTLLLERANEATKNYLKPNVHYVEFTNEQDLKEKIAYYLENDKEREDIAQKGYEEYKKKYTSDVFWTKIMKRCKIEL